MEVKWSTSGPALKIYYFFVLISFIFFLYRYRKSQIAVFIILLFFNGLFGFINKDVQNIYRIFLVGVAILLTLKTSDFYYTLSTNGFILICFVIFTITFLATAFNNHDYFFITFSQYSRYFIIFSMFLVLKMLLKNEEYRTFLDRLIRELFLLQVILSILKILTIGIQESVVGSVASQGGALATSLPILGFMFLWISKRGHLDRNDWLLIVGLLFVGFVSNKRAIWYVMPFVIILFMFYVPKRKISRRLIILSLFAGPLVFYMGLRLNPTLNREGRMWGSFDPSYAYDYARQYTFGDRKC